MLNIIRNIQDPEHPLTLEELNVVENARVKVRLSMNKLFNPFMPRDFLDKHISPRFIISSIASLEFHSFSS